VNVIVYVSDALRADHVGCYGARHVRTPTIDELAAGGLRFDQAISAAPWTCPSMTSMITGLYPHHHGVFHWDAALDPAVPTLFDLFAEAGYRTASFVFDESYLFTEVANANVQGTSERLDGALAWLREQHGEPFLLFVHSWATHMPYDVRHAERKEWRAAKSALLGAIQADDAAGVERWREAYRAAVEHQSETLFASLLEELDRLRLRETTAVAFLSDHGESWGERFVDKRDVQGIYHLHGATLHDEILRVPLVISAPNRIEPGVVTQQVRSVDLAPTLLDLAGIGAVECDGLSLLPLADGRERDDRLALAATTDRGALSQLALRSPPWKLILRVDSGAEEAYRLDVDPGELDSRPDEAPADLRSLLYLELESAERRELSEEDAAAVTARLADLGYL
jgi:arylsulfatase A-like enzyme